MSIYLASGCWVQEYPMSFILQIIVKISHYNLHQSAKSKCSSHKAECSQGHGKKRCSISYCFG